MTCYRPWAFPSETRSEEDKVSPFLACYKDTDCLSSGLSAPPLFSPGKVVWIYPDALVFPITAEPPSTVDLPIEAYTYFEDESLREAKRPILLETLNLRGSHMMIALRRIATLRGVEAILLFLVFYAQVVIATPTRHTTKLSVRANGGKWISEDFKNPKEVDSTSWKPSVFEALGIAAAHLVRTLDYDGPRRAIQVYPYFMSESMRPAGFNREEIPKDLFIRLIFYTGMPRPHLGLPPSRYVEHEQPKYSAAKWAYDRLNPRPGTSSTDPRPQLSGRLHSEDWSFSIYYMAGLHAPQVDGKPLGMFESPVFHSMNIRIEEDRHTECRSETPFVDTTEDTMEEPTEDTRDEPTEDTRDEPTEDTIDDLMKAVTVVPTADPIEVFGLPADTVEELLEDHLAIIDALSQDTWPNFETFRGHRQSSS
ncbi:MAG: hypothetical protein M1837_004277 [Sclerophora amabilis]|nr:MAG: hypothetical protein M1837_004277 [Sclerophora amabilis]